MSQELYGPRTELSRILHKMKYRGPEETFDDYCVRYARSTTTNEKDFRKLLRFLRTQTILPAGRQQLSVGRPFQTTCFNCFVGPTIGDHTKDIFDTVTLGALTMRTGGGVGWDFSTIRPKGEPIRGLGVGAVASGPVSFMNVWNAMCQTIISAGERRGAMMGVLRVDHPDILTFINAKKDDVSLKYFNISVAVTDKFMEAVDCDGLYDLQFNGVKFGSVRALDVWAVIMENNWDYAEPGILFIDRINRLNPLYYCEKIAATNPCITGDSLIAVAGKGGVPIKTLAEEGKDVPVYACNTKTGEIVVRWGKNPRLTQKNVPVLKVNLDDGSFFRCTYDHKIPLRDGRIVNAKDLVAGDSLFRFDSFTNSKTKQVDIYQRTGIRQYTPEHQLIAEAKFGKQNWGRNKGEMQVHHINHNHTDNSWKNISIKETGQHSSDHMVGDLNPMRFWWNNLSEKDKKEHAKKFSNTGENNGMWGKQHPEERKQRIGNKTKERFLNPEFKKKHREACLLALSKKQIELEVNHKVVSIKSDGFEDVYNITVDEFHNYIVITKNNYLSKKGVNLKSSGIALCNCGEQPLPAHGACLLASQNLVKFIQTESTKKPHLISDSGKPVKSYSFDFDMLDESVDATVRACDAVIDISYFPLSEQKEEALAKRRMGIGVTGMANVGEILRFSYGDENYLELQSKILQRILFQAYRSSVELAKEKGSFPLFDADKYLEGEFISKTLPDDIKDGIRKYGLRNGLLTSIAPTGTISLVADNVSSGIEPVFFHEGKRDIITPEGKKEFEVVDFAHNFYNVKGRTANEVTAQEHIKVLCEAQQFVDSSISKTCNVYGQIGGKGEGVNYSDFKELYMTAYKGGAKSCTTYNINGKRSSIFRTEEVKKSKKTKKVVNSSDVCIYDPLTGTRSCAE